MFFLSGWLKGLENNRLRLAWQSQYAVTSLCMKANKFYVALGRKCYIYYIFLCSISESDELRNTQFSSVVLNMYGLRAECLCMKENDTLEYN